MGSRKFGGRIRKMGRMLAGLTGTRDNRVGTFAVGVGAGGEKAAGHRRTPGRFATQYEYNQRRSAAGLAIPRKGPPLF